MSGRPTMTKTEAHYRKGLPKRNCSLCSMYRSGGTCTLVQGAIRPVDVCDHYEPKTRGKGTS
jgi:hypothetical protein